MTYTRTIQIVFGLGIAVIVVLAGAAIFDIRKGQTPPEQNVLVGNIPKDRLQQLFAQRTEFEGKITKDPKDVIAYVSLATIEKSLGNLKRAEQLLIRASEISPTNYLVLGNLADVYRMEKENDKARLMYQRALTYGQNEENNYLQYADFLRYRYPNEREAILAVYQQAIDHFDADEQFYRARADYFESVGETQQALQDWRAVLKQDPKNEQVQKKVQELATHGV